MSRIIKVIGAERSGTNYVSCLLLQNLNISIVSASNATKGAPFEIQSGLKYPKKKSVARNTWLLENEISLLGNRDILLHPTWEVPHWKHSPPTHAFLFRRPLIYVAIIKNPYSWYVSYKRYAPLHEKNPDSSIPAAIKRWNDLNSSYIKYSAAKNNLHLIRYEDWVVSPEEHLKKFSNKYQFVFNENNFRKIDFIASPGLMMAPMTPDKELDYANPFELYYSELSSQDVKDINAWVDFSIMKKVNYATYNG